MVILADNIACGVAGWSYPDWKGYVYEPGVRAQDQLRYLAEYVDVVEINSTFYRPPDARTAASWVHRTADLPRFGFTAKLNRQITHKGIVSPEMTDAFERGLAPLREAGKLTHLLAQFRYDFADSPETRTHLEKIKDAFANLSNLTLELRHNSWQSPSALEFLTSLEVSVANLDYPTARDSFNLRHCAIGDHAYLRLHGRNYKAWFSKAGRDETYNYLYAEDELKQIVERAVAIARNSKTLTLIANNHYQGKEAVNALQIRAMISGDKVKVPPALLKKYPELEKIAAG